MWETLIVLSMGLPMMGIQSMVHTKRQTHWQCPVGRLEIIARPAQRDVATVLVHVC